MHAEAQPNDPEGHNQSRSNAYEVALIDNRVMSQNGSFFMDEVLTNQEQPQHVPPLLIKIDLGGENYANIKAFINSNPLELATNFCQDYKLPDSIIEPLCYRIRTNIRTHFADSSQNNRIENKTKALTY